MADIIKYDQLHMLNLDYIRRVVEVLEDLIYFVLDIEDRKNKDPLKITGQPFHWRQKLVKDMKIFELLTDILYYPFHNKIYKIKQKSVDS